MPLTEEECISRIYRTGCLFCYSGSESLMIAWLNYYNSVNNTNFVSDETYGPKFVRVERSLSDDDQHRQVREHGFPLMSMVNGAGFELKINGATSMFPPRHYEISVAEQERVDLGWWLTEPFKMDMFLRINNLESPDEARESASGFLSPELRAFARMIAGEEVDMSEIYTQKLLRNAVNEKSKELSFYLRAAEGIYSYAEGLEEYEEKLKRAVRVSPPLMNPMFFIHPFMKVVAKRVYARLFLGQKPLDLYDQPPEIRTSTTPESQEQNNAGMSENDDEGKCLVCCDRPIQTMVLPCGHHVLCRECSSKMRGTPNMQRCIICRGRIDQILEQ